MAKAVILPVPPEQTFRWHKGDIVQNAVHCRYRTHRSFEHGVVWLEAAWALLPQVAIARH